MEGLHANPETETTQEKAGCFMANAVSYGADPTGTADSTAALQKACNENRHVYLPTGTYRVTALNMQESVTLQGAGNHNTVILSSVPTGNVITFSADGWNLRDLAFDSIGDRTDGAYVFSDANYASIANITVSRQYIGIDLDGCWTADLQNIIAYDGTPEEIAAGGAVIRLGNTQYTGPVHIRGLSAKTSSAERQPTSCITMGWVDVVSLSDVLIIWHRKELLITPKKKQFAALIEVTNCCFDTAENGMYICPQSGARVLRCGFANTWFGAHQTGGGIVVDGSDGAVTGLQFTNCMFLHNHGNGVSVFGSGSDGLYFSNCFSSANTGSGLFTADGAANIIWSGGVLGACHEGGGNMEYGYTTQPSCSGRILHASLKGNHLGTADDRTGAFETFGTI